MNQRIFIAILFLLHAVGAAGATLPILSSISDLTNRAPLSPTETVLVTGFDTNRPFPALEFIRDPEGSTNTPEYGITVWPSRGGGIWRKPSNGEYNVRWAGAWGDTIHDDTVPVEHLVELARTTSAELIFPRGVYSISRPITFRGNVPLKISSVSGGFATGWNPTNLVTESKLLYVGPPTNAFVTIQPDTGILYGLNISGITVDANGGAAVAMHIQRNTRGEVRQLRVANASDIGLRVDNSYYIRFQNFSASHNEIPFTTRPAVGLMLTNQANALIFESPNISGMTNWAVVIDGLSHANSILGGGIEANLGGGVLFGAGSRFCGLIGTWFEGNFDTNRFIVFETGSLENSADRIYMENRTGRVVVRGSYNKISSSQFGQLEFTDTAGNNDVSDVILGIGETPIGPIRFQNIRNLIDATALIRTNTFANPIAFYGGAIDMKSGTNAYPSARFTTDSILFGNGTNGYPTVGFYRISDVSLGTPNTIVFYRTGVNDGLFSSYVTGDSYSRASMSMPGKLSFGSGSEPPTVNLTYLSSGVAMLDYQQVIIRPSTNSTTISSYSSGSAQPGYRLNVDGRQQYGAGGTSLYDLATYRSGASEFTIEGNLLVTGGISLGGVSHSSWPSSGSGTSTNYPTIAAALADTGLVTGSTIRIQNYSAAVAWREGRDFVVTNAAPSYGTNYGNSFAAAGSKWILATDRFDRIQRAEHWGAPGDGITDCQPYLQSAITWMHTMSHATDIFTWSKGSRLILGAINGGRYYHATPIQIESGDEVFGEGRTSVKLVRNGDYDGIVATNSGTWNHIGIRDLGFYSSNTSGTNAHIRIRGGPTAPELSDLFLSSGVHGIITDGIQAGSIERVQIIAGHGNGIEIRNSGFATTGFLISRVEVLSGYSSPKTVGLIVSDSNGFTVEASMFENLSYGAILDGSLLAKFSDVSFEYTHDGGLLLTNYNANVKLSACRFRNSQITTNQAALLRSTTFVQGISIDGCTFENSSTNAAVIANALAIDLTSGSYGNTLLGALDFTGFSAARPIVGRFSQMGYNALYHFLVPDQPAFAPAYTSLMTRRTPQVGGLSTAGESSANAFYWERYSLQGPVRIWNLSGEHLTNSTATGGSTNLYHEQDGSVIFSTANLTTNLVYTLSPLLITSTASNAPPYARMRVVRTGTNGDYTCTISATTSRRIETGEAQDYIFDPTITNWTYLGSLRDSIGRPPVRYTNDAVSDPKPFYASQGSSLILTSNHVHLVGTTVQLGTNYSAYSTNPPTPGTRVSVTDVGDPAWGQGFVVNGGSESFGSNISGTQDWIFDGTNWVYEGFRFRQIPGDGGTYAIRFGQWYQLPIDTDAPSDGNEYVRKNGSWTISSGGGGGTTNATQVKVNGSAYLSIANFTDDSEITFAASGSTVTASVASGSIGTNKLSAAALSYLKDRSTDTGTQLYSTISDASTNVWQKILASIQRGKGIQLVTNAGANTLTIADNNIPGANLSTVTNADGSVTWSASTGSTNTGTAVSVNGSATLTAANLLSGSNTVVSATGSNVTVTVTNSGVTPGTYTKPTISIGADGRVFSATNGLPDTNFVQKSGDTMTGTLTLQSGLNLGGSLGTSNQVATSTGSGVIWKDVPATGSLDTNVFAHRGITNSFTATNTFNEYTYLKKDLILKEVGADNDLFGFYVSSGNLQFWSGSSTNAGGLAKNIWFSAQRYGPAAEQVGDISITSLGTIFLNGNVAINGTYTNSDSGSKQVTAGTNLTVGGTIKAGGSFGSAGQLLTSTGTGVAWSNAPPASGGDPTTNQFTVVHRGFQPGTNNYALFNSTNGFPVMVFDPDTEWSYRYALTVPGNLSSLPSTIRIKSWWRPIIGNSASQNIIVSAKYEAVVDSDSFTVANNVTNTVSSQTWIAFTNTLGTSNMTIGSPFVLNISAPSGGSATNLYQMQEAICVYWY